jgi:hypothetical protein
MPTGELEISYNGEPRSTPALRNINITVTLTNGTYIVQPKDYTLVVFYGRPPSYGSDYPVTSYYLYTNNLQFEGDLNSVYSVAQVQTAASSIQGTLTASQPLPYSVTIGLPGKPGETTLQPGQTSVSFSFPLAQLNTEEASGAVAARLEAIRKAA